MIASRAIAFHATPCGASACVLAIATIVVGIVVVGIVVGILALLLRTEQKKPAPPPPYAANLKFSDLKASAAQNFVGQQQRLEKARHSVQVS